MARATTSDLTMSGLQIVTQSLYEITAWGPYQIIDPAELADCLLVLNMMVKLWQGAPDIDTRGLKMWQRARASLTLAAKISYALQASGGDLDIITPVEILSIMFKDSNGTERPLSTMLAEQYHAIPDKSATGDPLRYYYERGYTTGTLYFDLIPATLTDTAELLYLRPLYDFDALSEDADFPQHWYTALYSNLAIFLCPRYGKKASQDLKDIAKYSLAKAQNFYPENVDMHFEPGRD